MAGGLQPRQEGMRMPDVTRRGTLSRRAAGFATALVMTVVPLVIIHGLASQPTLSECLGNTTIVTISGTQTQQVKYSTPAAGTTFDARTATFVSSPASTLYPLSIGKDNNPAAARLCIVGGKVVGQQSRTLTWDQMKTTYDGDAVRLTANNWYGIDGLRVDNIEDGVAPRGTDGLYPKDGDGFTMRNLYMTYIRDDCVENDDIGGGLVEDSLFDGCYTGVSERPSSTDQQNNYPAPAGETLTLDHVLLRLQQMPGPRDSNDPNILGHGQLFKWSPVANQLVVRDSIFLVEQQPNGGSADFPAGTVASNVTVVWLGGGAFPGTLPATGVTVVTDRSVWDNARTGWLTRHGCTSFDSCSKLHTPDPYGGPVPTPTPTVTPTVTPTPTPTPTVSPTPTPTPTPTITPTPTPTPTPTITPTPTPPVALTFGPSADAMVRKKNATKNFGTARQLNVDGDPLINSLVKFNVSGIGSRTVRRVRLVLSCLTTSVGCPEPVSPASSLFFLGHIVKSFPPS
jgi:hypothetical protein